MKHIFDKITKHKPDEETELTLIIISTSIIKVQN